MIGIYKITNKINNKTYIGQSINIENRWQQHKINAFNFNTHTYNYPLYRAIRKYGLDNFEFQVLEECNKEILTQEEQYYIDYYNSLNPNCGYNLVSAVDAKRGENCNWAKLSNKETYLIIDLIKNTSLSFIEIGNMFNVSGSCIEDINKGRCRRQNDLIYPLRLNSRSFAHKGEKQNTAILSEQEVLVIRNRYVTEDIMSIYKDYKNRISFCGFKKVVYGVTWKHLPCYKKHLKIWVYSK